MAGADGPSTWNLKSRVQRDNYSVGQSLKVLISLQQFGSMKAWDSLSHWLLIAPASCEPLQLAVRRQLTAWPCWAEDMMPALSAQAATTVVPVDHPLERYV